MIPFNRPYLTGNEEQYLHEVLASRKLCGNGPFTNRCQRFFEERYGFKKALFTSSGTDALEMAALLTEVGPGDEVIVPSFTFVSTALAFIRCGAKVVFADSRPDEPNLDASKIESLITPRTKVIVPVHYAGVACDMDAIMAVAEKYRLLVVEDAAHAIDSYHTGVKGRRPLGSIGHLGCFSFHETKNIVAGEGGLLVVNDERFLRRAEIVWEKGTNRSEFFRGMVNKYGWCDIGSSFLPSELNAAFLWAQLEKLDEIQNLRKAIWHRYAEALGKPVIPGYAENNAHMYYRLFPNLDARTAFMDDMKTKGVQTTFHYLPLHSSAYYASRHDGRELPNCDAYANGLVRLPLYADLTEAEIETVIASAKAALA